MNVDDIRLLYEYDRWANDRVLHAAAALSAEQSTRALNEGFGSVRDTLLHIVGGEWIWLAYWRKSVHGPEVVQDLVARRDELFRPNTFPNVAAVRSKWAEIAKEQAEFVSELTDEKLAKLIPFRDTQVSLAHLMQHMANHSTYHRGQIALMMRQLGAEAVATDFHVFFVEGRRDV